MTAPPTTGRLVAPLSGWAALVIARVLDREMPSRLLAVQAEVERGRIDPARLGELRETWAAIREAAAAWAASRDTSPASPASPDRAEVVRESREIDTGTAADILIVSTRRVRQLVATGELPGRQVTRRGHLVWLVNEQAVRERAEKFNGWG